jgi:hypothetical protein
VPDFGIHHVSSLSMEFGKAILRESPSTLAAAGDQVLAGHILADERSRDRSSSALSE